jgi:hypothetical protein
MWCWYFFSETDFQLLRLLNKASNPLLTAQELGWPVAVRLMCRETLSINEKTDRPWFELGSPVSFVAQYYMDIPTLQTNYKMVVYFREVARRVSHIPPLPTSFFKKLKLKTLICMSWLYQQLHACNSMGSAKAFFAFVVHVRWNYSTLKARKYICLDTVDYENDLFHSNTKRRRLDAFMTWEHLSNVQELYMCLHSFCLGIIKKYESAEVSVRSKCYKTMLTQQNVFDMFYNSVTDLKMASFIQEHDCLRSFLRKYLLTFFSLRWSMRIDCRKVIALY